MTCSLACQLLSVRVAAYRRGCEAFGVGTEGGYPLPDRLEVVEAGDAAGAGAPDADGHGPCR